MMDDLDGLVFKRTQCSLVQNKKSATNITEGDAENWEYLNLAQGCYYQWLIAASRGRVEGRLGLWIRTVTPWCWSLVLQWFALQSWFLVFILEPHKLSAQTLCIYTSNSNTSAGQETWGRAEVQVQLVIALSTRFLSSCHLRMKKWATLCGK